MRRQDQSFIGGEVKKEERKGGERKKQWSRGKVRIDGMRERGSTLMTLMLFVDV